MLNWRIAIDDMNVTSTKCTISFDSSKKNDIKPVNMTKTELVALNEEITNTSAKQLANYLYPVGSVYLSTEDDTIEKVQDKFGGTWVKYSEGTMLMGASSSYPVNTTGGSSILTLTTENLPSHNHGVNINTGIQSANHTHSIPALSGTAATAGYHTHDETYLNGDSNYVLGGGNWSNESKARYSLFAGQLTHTPTKTFAIKPSPNGNHTHSVTTVASTTGGNSVNHIHNISGSTTSTGSGTAINIQNPYISVYMYKRTA